MRDFEMVILIIGMIVSPALVVLPFLGIRRIRRPR